MKIRGPRRFTALALLNLVFWIGLAALVGLLLTDRLDLGLETLLRQGQATAVAAFERQTHLASPVARVEPANGIPRSPATRTPPPAPSSVLSPGAPSAAPTGRPAALVSPTVYHAAGASPHPSRPATVGSPGPLPTALPATSAAASPNPPAPTVASGRPTVVPGLADIAPGPTPPLRAVPLLLADPAFSDLTPLNAEMDRSAPGRPVQIRYQEAALNREIAILLADNPDLPYRDVTVDLRRDGVLVTGKVTVLGFQLNAAVEGTIVVRDCQPRFEIESVSVASLLAPGFVETRVAEMLQEAMAWYTPDYPLCLEQIVLEDTRATLYGARR